MGEKEEFSNENHEKPMELRSHWNYKECNRYKIVNQSYHKVPNIAIPKHMYEYKYNKWHKSIPFKWKYIHKHTQIQQKTDKNTEKKQAKGGRTPTRQ